MPGELWAITCLFNPAGFRSRARNYRVFRRRLEVPLVTVELAFDGQPFALGTGDAERLVQVRGGDRLWQKERLLNLALASLPDGCDKVVWLDCDTVFPEPGWPARVAASLENWRMVQVYDRLLDLAPGDDGTRGCDPVHISTAVLRALERGGLSDAFFRRTGGRGTAERAVIGIGWAFRREDLVTCGLYDACVTGSGDRAMLYAALGRQADLGPALHLNRARRAHFAAWAARFERRIAGLTHCLAGTALHLWHGDFAGRRPGRRHREFSAFDFDPVRDIEQGPQGAWRWASEKPAMHAWVADYFEGRQEDG